MSNFEDDFESKQLALLASQYPDVSAIDGEVTFHAESDEDRLSSTSWFLDDGDFKLVSETGFKFQLLELLDQLIQYRGQFNGKANKQGVIRFTGDGIKIFWGTD